MIYHPYIFRITVLTECCLPLVSIKYYVINTVFEKTYFFFYFYMLPRKLLILNLEAETEPKKVPLFQ